MMNRSAQETLTLNGSAANVTILSIFFGGFLAVLAIWTNAVNRTVTEPYLDEFFHVRQAQVYCRGQFLQWDPKITTPPGLYLVSVALRRLGVIGDCNLGHLRLLNSILLGILPCLLYTIIRHNLTQIPSIHKSKRDALRLVCRSAHQAVNVSLFPLLFFFSGLYYTDVISTISVLLTLWLRQNQFLSGKFFLRSILLLLNGLLALSYRQTNIFWVAIFPAILDTVDVLKEKLKLSYGDDDDKNRKMDIYRARVDLPFFKSCWNGDVLYDLPIDDLFTTDSNLEDVGLKFRLPVDVLKVSVSIALSTVSNVSTVAFVAAPYLTLVGLFGGFIAWNGSVVLGDKTNHVATLHVPQLLYLWPLIVFFSWPLVYPFILANIFPCALLPTTLRKYRPKYYIGPTQSSVSSSLLTPRRRLILISAVAFLTASILACVVIRYNTIVHPFTLADNRHYVFYVFRILLRNPSTKFLVAPIYILSAWSILQGLRKPCAPRMPAETKMARLKNVKIWDWWWNEEKVVYWKASELTPYSPDVCMTSYVLAWAIVTTLTLATAPLVEPRYFILPWIFWRLKVPGPTQELEEESKDPPDVGGDNMKAEERNSKIQELIKKIHDDQKIRCFQLLNHGDHRLWLETAWLLLVNSVIGYIFLYKGFLWPQEPNKIQRFMW